VSEGLVVDAPAKLNLGLQVLGRRDDGFHELLTVFQEIDLVDRLSLSPAAEISLQVRGLPAPAGGGNLVVQAARLLAEELGGARGAHMVLDKRIPAGAGLGGGSSDAASALLGLHRLWGGALGPEDLRRLAMRLGSDVPYFLVGGTALGMGRGEAVCPLPDLPSLAVCVVCPEQGLSTPEVYRRGDFPLTVLRKYNIINRFAQYVLSGEGLDELVRNDLQHAAAGLLPAIEEWCAKLRQEGALAAALTGSGSAVYGLFPDAAAASTAAESLGPRTRTFICRFRPRNHSRPAG
jgi:4-diphosphocytidyl-2-C-methyl-D-erythritol kinase